MKKAIIILLVLLLSVLAAGCIGTKQEHNTTATVHPIIITTQPENENTMLPLYTYTVTPVNNRIYYIANGGVETITIESGKVSGVPIKEFLSYVLPYIADYYEALIVASNTYSYYDFDTKTIEYTAYGLVYNNKFFAAVNGHTGAFYYMNTTHYIGCTRGGKNYTQIPPIVPYTDGKMLFVISGDYRTLTYSTITGEYTVYVAPGHWITLKEEKNTTT